MPSCLLLQHAPSVQLSAPWLLQLCRVASRHQLPDTTQHRKQTVRRRKQATIDRRSKIQYQQDTKNNLHAGTSTQPSSVAHTNLLSNKHAHSPKHGRHRRRIVYVTRSRRWVISTTPPAACDNKDRKAGLLRRLPVRACQRSWADCRSNRQGAFAQSCKAPDAQKRATRSAQRQATPRQKGT